MTTRGRRKWAHEMSTSIVKGKVVVACSCGELNEKVNDFREAKIMFDGHTGVKEKDPTFKDAA